MEERKEGKRDWGKEGRRKRGRRELWKEGRRERGKEERSEKEGKR